MVRHREREDTRPTREVRRIADGAICVIETADWDAARYELVVPVIPSVRVVTPRRELKDG
jgi:hypothetical protein